MNTICRLLFPILKLIRPFAASMAANRSRRHAALLLAALVPLGVLQAQSNYATPYTFTSFVGSTGTGGADGTGTTAKFYLPTAIAIDSAGNFYVADTGNDTIRKITPAGVVSTLAGVAQSPGHTDGTGPAARFYSPRGIGVDSAGNVYVSDFGNFTIRKITPAGVVTTLAGTAGTIGSVDGTGAAAVFAGPQGMALDSAGNIYVAESNYAIRKITPAGVVTTFAGAAGAFGHVDDTGAAARFTFPYGVAVDGANNVYVSDYGAIRKITPGAVVTTLAGVGAPTGSADGTGSAARFYAPSAMAVDGAGNVFVADTNNSTIRKVTAAGVVTTLAGKVATTGHVDGTGVAARFSNPYGLVVDSTGVLYVTDYTNGSIRKGVAGAGETVDFNADGKADLIWENTSTGDRLVWLMNGTSYSSSLFIGTVGTAWHIVGAADFNGDGQADLVWENTTTGDRYIWLMNGTSFVSAVYLSNLPAAWQIAGTGDFNGDGKPDIIWQNTVTGDRYIWFMNGTAFSASVYLGNVSAEWRIVGAGDFSGDGQTDLVWENTITGDRYIWLMNGTTFTSAVYLSNLAPAWHIGGAEDFNGDGKPDLIWENTSTGDRYIWLMNGTVFSSSVYLGNVTTQWLIKP
jgi:hypothetical protein